MKTLPLLFIFAVSACPVCVPVTASRIFGRDFALADPRLSALPSGVVVGFTPAPGTKRIYSSAELERIARENGVPVAGLQDLCFEFPLHEIGVEEAAATMLRSLPRLQACASSNCRRPECQRVKFTFPWIALRPRHRPDSRKCGAVSSSTRKTGARPFGRKSLYPCPSHPWSPRATSRLIFRSTPPCFTRLPADFLARGFRPRDSQRPH